MLENALGVSRCVALVSVTNCYRSEACVLVPAFAEKIGRPPLSCLFLVGNFGGKCGVSLLNGSRQKGGNTGVGIDTNIVPFWSLYSYTRIPANTLF